MTLDQVEALCTGIAKIERMEVVRTANLTRLAMHGSDDDFDDFVRGVDRDDDDAAIEALIAKYSEGGNG